jgi:N-acetylglucosaminyldiphosphoundecaprenol N-acetyl-beta-D-mannosaminyltransferase
MPPRKVPVLGVGISVTSYGEVLRTCREWVGYRRQWKQAGSPADSRPPGRFAAFLSVHPVMTAVFDRAVRTVLNGADIAATDGMPLVWALRSFGAKGQRRVYGPDLMLALCGQAARLGHRVFLYGGRPDTLSQLCDRLRAKFPALEIVDAYAPPFRPLTPEEDRACMTRILSSDADLVFVGIGAPKQERWMTEHRAELPGVVMLGVGAAFDFHAGSVRQAPPWMQRRGLEWLFRLCAEPKRLWRRYLVVNPLFLVMWALQSAGVLTYDLKR